MFNKILIANRGEIALRIIRTCKELGIKTVAVYSEADRDSLHVTFADEAVCIGPSQGKESYLKIPSIISAAQITGADAIHPGYGFLAENANFSEICNESGIKFIGPSPEMINAMGDKAYAKETMKKNGVPVIPGSDGVIKSSDEGKSIAEEIGFPVIIKASAGGGGKGMRIVWERNDFDSAFQMARNEAEASFGNPEVYLEKYVENPRHVEIQIMGDSFGNVYHYGERDCSVQRRHQKLIEESPSPALDQPLREKMGQTAILGAKSVNYEGAGTVEFLLDKNKNFYFMEMNTRIQVEHPVTEMVTGLDLVKEQIRLAAGEKILVDSDDITIRGAAIECRINAEDPEKEFLPSPGKIEQFILPGGPGIRVDTHGYAGYIIPSFYDSLLAKIISMGENRAEAIGKMQRALREFIIEGVKTTIPLHQQILNNEDFLKGEVFTNFLHKHILGGTDGK